MRAIIRVVDVSINTVCKMLLKRQREQGHFHALLRSAHLVPRQHPLSNLNSVSPIKRK